MKNIFKKIITHILTFEAKILLKRHQPKIIAVTGSVGKTSTKDAIYSILKSKYTVRKSEKSFNSEIGIPLTVLGLPNAWTNPFLWLKNIVEGFLIAIFSRDYPEYLVLETGIDRPGDMTRLTAWLKPNIAVLTRLPDIPVHGEYFKLPEDVVKEKMQLLYALQPEGVVVYNHDDQTIQTQLSTVRHQAIGYSRYLSSDYTASKDETYYNDDVPEGIKFTVKHQDRSEEIYVKGVIGMQSVYTFAGAIAVAGACGVSLEEAREALKEHESPPGRMRVLPGIKGSIIIDDTYNSSPIAAEHALMTLKDIRHAKRKIAVLGDMLELGRFSANEHERIGELVPKCANLLFTVGVRAKKIAQGALMGGLNDKNIFQYENMDRLNGELQSFMEPGDVILIKASQGIRAEKVVEEIMAEPESAKELLVRQDEAWSKR